MSSLPLIFTFRDLIVGRGFYAMVEATGRVLLAEEDGEAWMYGVSPGGLASGAPERAMAFLEFKKDYQAVLFDIAGQAVSFDAFKAEVERFIREVNVPAAEDWDAALLRIREGHCSTDQGLHVLRAEERPTAIEVHQVIVPEPGVNASDELYAKAA